MGCDICLKFESKNHSVKSMLNIRFNYLYRDADNYKLFGSEVFSQKRGLRLSDIEKLIRSALIRKQYFYPAEWKLPLLYSDDGWGMEEMDWCEFEGLEEMTDQVTVGGIWELLR